MTDTAAVRMRVRDLRVDVTAGEESILRGVNFELKAGEVFALVGESGSGKSVTSLAAMRLLPEALKITAGAVDVAGQDLFDLPEADMRSVRGRRVGSDIADWPPHITGLPRRTEDSPPYLRPMLEVGRLVLQAPSVDCTVPARPYDRGS